VGTPIAEDVAMTLRLLAPLLLLAPVVACSVTADGAPEDVAASSGAISGQIAAGSQLKTTARVTLREGPSQSADVLLTMPSGATVTAISGTPSNRYYEVSYNGNAGWTYGAYLAPTGSTTGDNASDDEDEAPATSGSFNGRTYSGVTMLWQGNWDFLVRCDSYSRSKGRVVFFCDETPSRSFVDEGAWIAVPRANFSSTLCGKNARVCKGSKCIVAKVVEKSETTGKWEGSTAVLDALGADTGFSGCSSSFGTATGVTVTMQ
jgi:Bacterial SH3 domain